jgi:hypothetical protein
MLKRYATAGQRQLLNIKRHYGWLVGDRLDAAIAYLEQLRTGQLNPERFTFIRPFCAQLAWDWAPSSRIERNVITSGLRV